MNKKRNIILVFFLVGVAVVASSGLYLRVSTEQMKQRVADNLSIGANGSTKSQVKNFLQSQHMNIKPAGFDVPVGHPAQVDRLTVKAKPFLSAPIYLKFYFDRQQNLVGYDISDRPMGDVAGAIVYTSTQQSVAPDRL